MSCGLKYSLINDTWQFFTYLGTHMSSDRVILTVVLRFGGCSIPFSQYYGSLNVICYWGLSINQGLNMWPSHANTQGSICGLVANDWLFGKVSVCVCVCACVLERTWGISFFILYHVFGVDVRSLPFTWLYCTSLSADLVLMYSI